MRRIISDAGFTLTEVVIAAAILVVLAKFAMMKLVTPATLTLPVQAQTAADHLRRAQTQAMACSQRMVVTVPSSSVISVASAGSPACLPPSDYALSHGVQVSGSTLRFNTLGQPVDNAGTPLATATSYTLTFTIGAVTSTSTVTVEPLTGRVSVN
jgi:prepilin-type N-terminal cleavage/methylation domain-containing protein